MKKDNRKTCATLIKDRNIKGKEKKINLITLSMFRAGLVRAASGKPLKIN